jgi:hypothetical protein
VIVPSSSGGGDDNNSPFGGGRGNRGGPFGGGNNNLSGRFNSAFGGGDNNDNNRPARPTTRPFPSADGAFGPRPVGGAFNRPAFGGNDGDNNDNPIRVVNNNRPSFGNVGNNNNAFFADRNNGDGDRPVRVINANNGNNNNNWNRPPTRPAFNNNNGNGNGNNRGNNKNNNNNDWNGPPALRPYRMGELEIRPEALQSGVPRVSGLSRPNINRGNAGAFNPAFRDRVYRGFGGVGDFGARNFGSRADANAVAQTLAQAGGAADATAAAEAVVEAARGGRATAVAEAYARAARYNRGGAARVMARSAAVAYERGDPYVQSLASSTAEAFTAAKAAGTLNDFAGAMAQALAEGGEYGQATFGQAMAKAMATSEGQAAVAEATASVFCGPGTYATAWAEAMSVALSRDSRGCLVLNKAKAIAVARCNGGVFSAEAKAEATSRVLGFCGLRPWYSSGGGGNNWGNNNNNWGGGDDDGWRGPIGAGGPGGIGGGGLAQNLLNRIGERIDQRLGGGGYGGRAPFERADASADAQAAAESDD